MPSAIDNIHLKIHLSIAIRKKKQKQNKCNSILYHFIKKLIFHAQKKYCCHKHNDNKTLCVGSVSVHFNFSAIERYHEKYVRHVYKYFSQYSRDT